ncbi:hypothetical protein BBUWI9123_D0016 (plasmid) [Borreliella burgdorferi WI91-23]|nr:hypothetical protein BBUWI9123_D0016 [Borreliella burgdorferi WI91-23]ACO37745.1 hypothetical protein BBUBOL26_D17 [Borreliella burgdorferi Bol26]
MRFASLFNLSKKLLSARLESIHAQKRFKVLISFKSENLFLYLPRLMLKLFLFFYKNLSYHLTFCHTKILQIQILLKIFLISVRIYSVFTNFIGTYILYYFIIIT